MTAMAPSGRQDSQVADSPCAFRLHGYGLLRRKASLAESRVHDRPADSRDETQDADAGSAGTDECQGGLGERVPSLDLKAAAFTLRQFLNPHRAIRRA